MIAELGYDLAVQLNLVFRIRISAIPNAIAEISTVDAVGTQLTTNALFCVAIKHD